MTDDELRKLAEAALEQDKAATPGPWEAYSAPCCPDMGGVSGPKSQVLSACVGRYGHPATIEDAESMAAARTREPELARAVLRLLEERDGARQELEDALEAAQHAAWEREEHNE